MHSGFGLFSGSCGLLEQVYANLVLCMDIRGLCKLDSGATGRVFSSSSRSVKRSKLRVPQSQSAPQSVTENKSRDHLQFSYVQIT